MKNNRKNESGRTLTEMIAVLIIIGILTIASLGGYSFLVKKWRSHESVGQINALIVGMRSGNLSKRYGESVIPVQTIARGLKTRDNAVAVLPDSNDSWAKVTSFGMNTYMIELEVQPGTCEELLAEDTGADLIKLDVPADGEWKNAEAYAKFTENQNAEINGQSLATWGIVTGTAAKGLSDEAQAERAQKIREICGIQPRMSLVWGCSEGSQNYFYGGKCYTCDVKNGEVEYAKHKCCKKENLKTAEDGTQYCTDDCKAPYVSDPKTGLCYECVNDNDCKNRKDYSYSTKVCDPKKHKCVECLDSDAHCKDPTTYGFKNLAKIAAALKKQGWTKTICNTDTQRCVECSRQNPDCKGKLFVVDGQVAVGACLVDQFRCVGCISSYHGTSELGECPSNYPICVNPGVPDTYDDEGVVTKVGARCEPCPKDADGNQTTWSIERQKCICPNGMIAGPNGCTKCIPWNASSGVLNDGCSVPGSPTDTCIDTGTPGVDEGDPLSGTCVECATDYGADKLEDGNAYKSRSAADMCTKDKPYCSNGLHWAKNKKFSCYKCLAIDGPVKGVHLGCKADQPVCDENGNGGVGKCGCNTNTDCLANYQCDEDEHVCVPCNHSGKNPLDDPYRSRRRKDAARCECPQPGTKVPEDDGTEVLYTGEETYKLCGTKIADVTGAKCGDQAGSSWVCKPGCQLNTDCAADMQCVGGSKTDKLVGKCGPCPTGMFRDVDDLACRACNACEILETYTGEDGKQHRRCVEHCKEDFICLTRERCVSNVVDGSCKITEQGGSCEVKPNPDELIEMPGVYEGTFWLPPLPPGNKDFWRLTWEDAGRFCQAFDMHLASVQEACKKDLHADSGHDCPNITDHRSTDSNYEGHHTWRYHNVEYNIGQWTAASGGTFWLNALQPGTCESLRVTSTCGNNHPTDVCDLYYPLCTR